ncbi:MAG TPA: BTAD domain-containing putative transcriptional regulator [Kineosporiaceae bacterium]|nr:BTAD domain-containing putative transcriptional regulator [Kineosporiaceae bacterium]
MEAVTFGLLGPTEVGVPGRSPVALQPSVRALLARLALNPGRVVSVDTLTDALWGENLPSDAANALQIRVSKLRRALVATGVPGDVVLTRAPGYLLGVEPDAVDAHRFEQFLTRARRLVTEGSCQDALTTLEEALALWRGPALGDVGDAEWTVAESARLDELRIGALEDRLELLLDLGRPSEAVADLERLATLHPLRERVHRLLMVAQYRAGRQADALTLYHRLRTRLAVELGIDPSPELQTLAEAILRQQLPSPTAPPSPTIVRPAAADSRPDSAGPPVPARAVPRPATAPSALSSVIGRSDDVDTILGLLADTRLVTLTGPGGVGKTTLSLEVARQLDPSLSGAVEIIRLAALEPSGDVGEAFARQLGLFPPGPGEATALAILDHLADHHALLLVDNCEHVLDSAAALLERVLLACPQVAVLATSREAFALPGEVQVAVHPLTVPAEGADLATIGQASAVQLFVHRARAVRPSFGLDADNAPVVALICRQLDGVPLAIELAAARVKALPVQEIANRLGDRFTFLTAGPRSGEARHRTLRTTLDWSYQLLSPAEQALLRRLAVFRGGWTLDAAERVCPFGDLTAEEVLDLLFRLVDRSLVVPDPDTGRFRLLVTIRDYGWAKLRETDEAVLVQKQHLEYFSVFAEEHGSLTRTGGPGSARMREEHDNLRSALDYAIDRARRTGLPEDVDAGYRLANAMVWFWAWNLRYEGVAAVTALLAIPGGSLTCRALALQGLGVFHVHCPTPRSRAAAQESLTLLEELGDSQNAAVSRLVIAWTGQFGPEFERSWDLVRRAEEELDHEAEPGTRVLLHYLKALLHVGQGTFSASIPEWEIGLEHARAIDHRVLQGAMSSHRGIALRETGRQTEAIDALRRAVELDERGGSLHGLAFALVQLAHTLLSSGAHEEARALLSRANDVAHRVQNPRCQAWAAWGRARLAFDARQPGLALEECRRATDVFQNREYPWAIAQLWAFLAEAAAAAGEPDAAADARAQARQALVSHNAGH